MVSSDSSIGERPNELRARLASQAHLWICGPEDWSDELLEELLAPHELERARTFRHPVAQRNYLGGRALVRTALSHYGGSPPANWRFSSGRFGRPEITGPGPRRALRFNLSHTEGLAACVVTAEVDCGVDVEKLDRRLRPLRIAEHSFATEEFQDLEGRSERQLRERFFSYWTLKEAYYKARGSGIPIRLKGARFRMVEDNRLVFEPAASEGIDASGWQFDLLRPGSEHVLAVALEAGAGAELELACFAMSEADGHQSFAPIDLPAVRATAVRTLSERSS